MPYTDDKRPDSSFQDSSYTTPGKGRLVVGKIRLPNVSIVTNTGEIMGVDPSNILFDVKDRIVIENVIEALYTYFGNYINTLYRTVAYVEMLPRIVLEDMEKIYGSTIPLSFDSFEKPPTTYEDMIKRFWWNILNGVDHIEALQVFMKDFWSRPIKGILMLAPLIHQMLDEYKKSESGNIPEKILARLSIAVRDLQDENRGKLRILASGDITTALFLALCRVLEGLYPMAQQIRRIKENISQIEDDIKRETQNYEKMAKELIKLYKSYEEAFEEAKKAEESYKKLGVSLPENAPLEEDIVKYTRNLTREKIPLPESAKESTVRALVDYNKKMTELLTIVSDFFGLQALFDAKRIYVDGLRRRATNLCSELEAYNLGLTRGLNTVNKIENTLCEMIKLGRLSVLGATSFGNIVVTCLTVTKGEEKLVIGLRGAARGLSQTIKEIIISEYFGNQLALRQEELTGELLEISEEQPKSQYDKDI